ncbi:hypothetical protein EYF80_036624 [Liparis tanakae]|uniref:Uncharacterized protein n=1 Tax=Liparis tanakae TaxID=230148 RepID=A0A4Z2GJW8_9TELE|nr:hypothetical protein EYF80_036624 [Liparis tanakae]
MWIQGDVAPPQGLRPGGIPYAATKPKKPFVETTGRLTVRSPSFSFLWQMWRPEIRLSNNR